MRGDLWTKAFTLVLSSLAWVHSPASAETIIVDHSGDDTIGKLVAFELVQALVEDPDFRVGSAHEGNWRIIIMTASMGEASHFSATLVRREDDAPFDSYVAAFLGVCGIDRVKQCGLSILERTRPLIQDFEAHWGEHQPSGSQSRDEGGSSTGWWSDQQRMAWF